MLGCHTVYELSMRHSELNFNKYLPENIFFCLAYSFACFSLRKAYKENVNFCEICGKYFSKISALKLHSKTVHDKVRTFNCELCERTFGQKHNLKTHISAVHDNTKRYSCDSCPKSFGYKCNLERHVKAVHEYDTTMYNCVSCDKKFNLKANLARHLESVHEKKKDFKAASLV